MSSTNFFFRESSSDGQPEPGFMHLSEDQLEAHMQKKARHGTFQLTKAIRPADASTIVPRQGYRHDNYRDPESGASIPALVASVSRGRLLNLFDALLEPLGEEVAVVLETSHNCTHGNHKHLYRDHIDTSVLRSALMDFEDVLLNDGGTGIVVVNPQIPLEVQFDENKLLIVCGHELEQFERILQELGIWRNEQIKFITEGKHFNFSSDEFQRRFGELRCRLGLDDE